MNYFMKILEFLSFVGGFIWAVLIGPEGVALRLEKKERSRLRGDE